MKHTHIFFGRAYSHSSLQPTDDGNGQWKSGFMEDEFHPNTQGHAAMYTAVDVAALLKVIEQNEWNHFESIFFGKKNNLIRLGCGDEIN